MERDDESTADQVATTRRQVIAYVAVVLLLSYALQAWHLAGGGGLGTMGAGGVLLMMWIPALVSIGFRLAWREGWRDVGWRAGAWRYWWLALAIPALCAVATYLPAIGLGLVEFEMPERHVVEMGSGMGTWLVTVTTHLPLALAFGLVACFGEELGWRGYLLTRLCRGGFRRPLLISGLVWGVWHLPVILWGDYATSDVPWLSALLFIVTVVLAAYLVGWLRLAGGSVWVATVMHWSHNFTYQNVFDRWWNGDLEPYFAGEAGVFSILAYGAVVFWLARSGRLRAALERPVWYAAQEEGT